MKPSENMGNKLTCEEEKLENPKTKFMMLPCKSKVCEPKLILFEHLNQGLENPRKNPGIWPKH